ncbi:hypothetical protein HGH92_22115 [Chitinophaga varians]|uniref:Uncharacterized protein n=1 Tax=Chitinophaga varians TaxID=2202339 RepID=A0A847RMK2_9BACT|nr:hypothetical protein [Chitinophaga varians]NLR67020.1 hypothetical protein [Chitinophaga varians]
MKYLWILGLLVSSGYNGMAQMKAPADWVRYEEVLGVKNNQRHYDYDVSVVRASCPTNVLWPGEQPSYTLQVVNRLNEPIVATGSIELIPYGTRGLPGDIWLPEMVRQGEVATVPVKVNIPAGGYINIEHLPSIPARFGGYALVMDLGRYGRRMITSLVRTFAANPQRLQYPKQSLDDMGADFLQRIGVQAIRMGVDYTPTTAPDYTQKMKELDAKIKEYQSKNITVLLMFGAGTAPLPLGMPRSFLDSNRVMKKTKQDFVWAPGSDADFQLFVNRLCVQYGWPRGPVTAVSLWNEPWEGASISGWQSDILRYREIYTVMAQAVLDARKKGADVLVGGGDSNSNAWDKLFADGKMTFLPVFDFCSIHYQGIETPALYPEWVNRQSPRGRVKIWDTESWVGNTDDRIGLTVATNRASGYDRSMGIYAGYMYTGGRGSEHFTQKVRTPEGTKEITRIPDTWSQAAALGAVQHLVGERNFNRLLFTNGLPWIMVFDGQNNPDDGTAVVSGDIGEAFGPERVLFRDVRGLPEMADKEQIRAALAAGSANADSLQQAQQQYRPLSGGRMLLPAASYLRLYDFYGNQLFAENGYLIIPLNSQGYYLRTDGSKGAFTKLLAALKTARIEGYEPVEIIAKDMTARISQSPVMRLQLTNILNRPVKGRLAVALQGLRVSVPDTVVLAPHETRTIPVQITGGVAAANNTYPLSVHFDAGTDGMATHYEDMHVNVISRLSIHVDGKLDDWQQALPQTVSSKGAATVSVTEAAWYPFKNFDTNANGYANGYFAYDDQYFYFAAKVADSTPHPGTYRFAQRPDDEFFYPDTSYVLDMQQSLVIKENSVPATDAGALQLPNGDGRIMHYWESGDNTNSFGLDLHLPKATQVALYLPSLRVSSARLEVYDNATGKNLFRRTLTNLWGGAWEVLRLEGDVRIVLHSNAWWYTAKLAALMFDQPSSDSIFVKEDFDTRGNWKGAYGAWGHHIVGTTPRLPAGVTVTPAFKEIKQPLIWPAGVRHYTYQKNPVTPDNSGLGYSYDNVLLAFNVIPEGKDGMLSHPPGTMPRFTGYKCTDYEYAFNPVAAQYGGGTEMWRLLVPGLNRKHFFPRQPKSEKEGPVTNSKLVVRREGNTVITECAIPWSEIPDVKAAMDKGERIKLSFRVNDNGAPGSCMELAKERSVSKLNARAFHPDWKVHWANEVEFGVEK